MNNNNNPPDSYSGGKSKIEIIPSGERRRNNEMAERDALFGENPLKNEPTLNEYSRDLLADDDDGFEGKREPAIDVNFDDPSPPRSPPSALADWSDGFPTDELGFASPSPAASIDSEFHQDLPLSMGNDAAPLVPLVVEDSREIGSANFPASSFLTSSGPLTPVDVLPDRRRCSETSSEVSLPLSVGSEPAEDVKRRRTKIEMNSLTADGKLELKRDQNNICSQKCRQKKKNKEAELEEQVELLKKEDEELKRENDVEESMVPPESVASKKERDFLENKIQGFQLKLNAIASERAALDESKDRGSKQWKAQKSTNGSQKCRAGKELKIAELELKIHELNLSIGHQKSIRAELRNALGREDLDTPPPPTPPTPSDLEFDEPPILLPQGNPRGYFEPGGFPNPLQCQPNFKQNNTKAFDASPLPLEELVDVGNAPVDAWNVLEPDWDPGDYQDSTADRDPDSVKSSPPIEQKNHFEAVLEDLDPTMFDNNSAEENPAEKDPMEGKCVSNFNIFEFVDGENEEDYDPSPSSDMVNGQPLITTMHPTAMGEHWNISVAQRGTLVMDSLPSQPGWLPVVPADSGIAAYNPDKNLASAGFHSPPGHLGDTSDGLLVPTPNSYAQHRKKRNKTMRKEAGEAAENKLHNFTKPQVSVGGAQTCQGQNLPQANPITLSSNDDVYSAITADVMAEDKKHNFEKSQFRDLGRQAPPMGLDRALVNPIQSSTITATAGNEKGNDWQLHNRSSQAPPRYEGEQGCPVPSAILNTADTPSLGAQSIGAASSVYAATTTRKPLLYDWEDRQAPRGLDRTPANPIPVTLNFDHSTTTFTTTAENQNMICDNSQGNEWQLHSGSSQAPPGWGGGLDQPVSSVILNTADTPLLAARSTDAINTAHTASAPSKPLLRDQGRQAARGLDRTPTNPNPMSFINNKTSENKNNICDDWQLRDRSEQAPSGWGGELTHLVPSAILSTADTPSLAGQQSAGSVFTGAASNKPLLRDQCLQAPRGLDGSRAQAEDRNSICDKWQLPSGGNQAPPECGGSLERPVSSFTPDTAYTSSLAARFIDAASPAYSVAAHGPLKSQMEPVTPSGHRTTSLSQPTVATSATHARGALHSFPRTLDPRRSPQEGQKARSKRKHDSNDEDSLRPSPPKTARGGSTMAAARGGQWGPEPTIGVPTRAPRSHNTHPHTHTAAPEGAAGSVSEAGGLEP